MTYQILKPEITNISKAVLDTAKVRWQFWVILIVALSSGIALGRWVGFDVIVFWPVLAVAIYFALVRNKILGSFWKRFAEINGWEYYDGHTDPEKEAGLMFRQGNNKIISHLIRGSINNRHFRIFSYEFSTGSGRHRRTYSYTVFAFKFNGFFPHIYLNNKHNSYNINAGEKISLPAEFEKKFSLSAPRKYEIEALAIFTPDILASLLDNGFAHDVEFVDQEVLIFADGQVDKFEKLEREFNLALKLEDMLDEKLDRFKFQPIGDMPHIL